MPNRKHQYHVGNAVTFRGAFEIDGVAQTPDAGSLTVTISQQGVAALIVENVAGVIAGTQLRYKYTPLVVGQFAIFLTAEYGSGADKRTGVIEFTVRKKEAH
jgi:hypothetical protein